MKKTTNQVVAAGTGAALTKGQTITFDYVLVDGRTGKELETSFGNTPGSLTLDTKKTATQLVTSLTGKTVGYAAARRHRAEGRPRQAAQQPRR